MDGGRREIGKKCCQIYGWDLDELDFGCIWQGSEILCTYISLERYKSSISMSTYRPYRLIRRPSHFENTPRQPDFSPLSIKNRVSRPSRSRVAHTNVGWDHEWLECRIIARFLVLILIMVFVLKSEMERGEEFCEEDTQTPQVSGERVIVSRSEKEFWSPVGTTRLH